MTIKNDLQALIHFAEAHGWTVKPSTGRNNSHVRLQAPNGEVFFASNSPSDRRGVLNLRADMRRRGNLPLSDKET